MVHKSIPNSSGQWIFSRACWLIKSENKMRAINKNYWVKHSRNLAFDCKIIGYWLGDVIRYIYLCRRGARRISPWIMYSEWGLKVIALVVNSTGVRLSLIKREWCWLTQWGKTMEIKSKRTEWVGIIES